jgi:tRNA-dihydrouridine synthase A
MITSAAVLNGDREQLLAFDQSEHPVALQLGGSEPADMAQCARIAEEQGFDEVNMNVGCPSKRVRAGRFGACLMAEPERVAACVAAMKSAVSIPVTVKTRIGIDDQDAEESLDRFINEVAKAGCTTFIVHARKAWLQGLSPKENRDVPPLDHDRVHRLKARRPDLEIIINGGIASLTEAQPHLELTDGVMLGRAAYADPYLLAEVDRALYRADTPVLTRDQVLDAFKPYVERELARGARLNSMTRHILGLFHGQPRARAFRRHLAENAHLDGAGFAVLEQAHSIVRGAAAQVVAAE